MITQESVIQLVSDRTYPLLSTFPDSVLSASIRKTIQRIKALEIAFNSQKTSAVRMLAMNVSCEAQEIIDCLLSLQKVTSGNLFLEEMKSILVLDILDKPVT